MDRRRFLQAVGATGTATMTALAGCGMLGGGGTPNGERASYDDWVASDAGSDGTVSAFTLELSMLRDLRDQSTTEETTTEETASGEETTTEPDVLSAIPATYVVGAAFSLGFGLGQVGLSGLVDEDGSADTVHFVGGGVVMEGSIDAEGVGSSVSEAGASEVETYEGYTLYQGGSGGDAVAIAVSGDAVVYVSAGEDTPDPMAEAKTLVDAGSGSGDRYRDASDDYDALVTSLPSRDLEAVEFDEDGGLFEGESTAEDSSFSGMRGFSDIDLSGNALGGAVSASLSQDELVSTIALRYENADAVDAKEDIEAALGGQADDRSVTIDGQMAYVEGTYSQDSS